MVIVQWVTTKILRLDGLDKKLIKITDKYLLLHFEDLAAPQYGHLRDDSDKMLV